MNLENFYFLSQIAAALGIMLSVIFVGLQIQQNTQATRANRRQVVIRLAAPIRDKLRLD
ncbi:MAG: hypothetical protein ABJP70_00465 [Erythrobacter sp.]